MDGKGWPRNVITITRSIASARVPMTIEAVWRASGVFADSYLYAYLLRPASLSHRVDLVNGKKEIFIRLFSAE